MEVTTTSQQTQQILPAEASSTTLNSDYETFLQMLTTQMNNQDPLDPVDSADYAVQLATFSSVEQQVLTNDLLTAMQAQLTTMGISQLAGWVGMDAQAQAPGYFDGHPIEVATYPDSLADSVEFVVRNDHGSVVSRYDIDAGQQSLEWNGVDNNGAILPDGLYSFSTESFSNGQSLGEQGAQTYSRIIEARTENGGISLVLEGGVAVNSTEIVALRNPS